MLSVSSVGSEAMQLAVGYEQGRIHWWPFSILGRIGGDATAKMASGRNHLSSSFSILGRIGGDATSEQRDRGIAGGFGFQYPRSDRRRCNVEVSAGREEDEWSFSILGRIGGDATACYHAKARQHPAFSILGRIGGDATSDAVVAVGDDEDFQYPRSDRRRCNHRFSFFWVERFFSFQYPRSDRRRCNRAYIGIPHRSQ